MGTQQNCPISHLQRVYCHLAMVNFSFLSPENIQSACEYVCKFLSTFSKREQYIPNKNLVAYCTLEPKSRNQGSKFHSPELYPLTLECILPIFVDCFVQKLVFVMFVTDISCFILQLAKNIFNNFEFKFVCFYFSIFPINV